MRYIINDIGKGPKRLLKQIKTIDEVTKKEQIIYDRNEIEGKLIEQNLHRFKKVHNIRVYQDKIYYKLLENETRNKILDGTLKLEDCNNADVYQFLSLLK